MKIKIFVILLLLLASSYLYFKKVYRNKTIVPSPSFFTLDRPLSEDTINCEFKTISSFTYENIDKPYLDENRFIYYNKPSKSDQGNLITFTGLTTTSPKIKGNQGEFDINMIKNDDETIVLLEKNLVGDIFTYTIFKKEKVATWYKGYLMIGVPYAMLSMGYCY